MYLSIGNFVMINLTTLLYAKHDVNCTICNILVEKFIIIRLKGAELFTFILASGTIVTTIKLIILLINITKKQTVGYMTLHNK